MFLYFTDSDVEADRFEDEGESSEEGDGEALEDAVETEETGKSTMDIERDTLEASGNECVCLFNRNNCSLLWSRLIFL